MSLRTLTVRVSPAMYAELERRAERLRSTVADELVRAAEKGVSSEEQLPAELEAELTALDRADDRILWTAARSRLSDEDGERLEELHTLRGARDLSPEEEDEAQALLAQSDRCMLVRAKAMALLKNRGNDISVLLRP